MTALQLINLDQDLPGYRDFIGCWLYDSPQLVYLVDPGPACSSSYLIEQLQKRGITRLDFMLLTHIHLDHAGGAARLLQAFPSARLYCHPRGRAHLSHPDKLWRGSQQVLGPLALHYGQPLGCPAQCFIDETQLADFGIQPIFTPGHAVHHVSFIHRDIAYVGEALGTRQQLPDGGEYLRPATPPRFILDLALHSIEALAAQSARQVAFAHFGMSNELSLWCQRAKRQLLLWHEVIEQHLHVPEEKLAERVFAALQARDELFGRGNFGALPRDIQQREQTFFGNSLRGIAQSFRA